MKKSAFLGRPGTAAKDGPEYAALVFLPCSDLGPVWEGFWSGFTSGSR